MKKITISKERLSLSDEVVGFFTKKVTPFGTGAKVDCPKEYLGNTAYLIIRKNDPRRRTAKDKRGGKKTSKGEQRT